MRFTRKDSNLSRKCKLNGLKYLFQSNEIDNVGNFQQQPETLIILLTHVKVLIQNEKWFVDIKWRIRYSCYSNCLVKNVFRKEDLHLHVFGFLHALACVWISSCKRSR